MNGGDENALRLGSGRLGKHGLPPAIGVIPNLTPINRNENDGVFPPQQHEAISFQRVSNALREPRSPHHSMPDRHGDISAKSGELEMVRKPA